MTEIIAFGLSRQPHYGSGLEGKQTRGFSEHRESCSSVQKEIDWIGPPPLLTPGVPQILLEQGLVWGPLSTFSPDCPESPTPGVYTSEGCLFSSVVLYRLGMEPGAA